MIIVIRTTENRLQYQINDECRKTSNDELCRVIAYLEIVKQDLISRIDHDYEFWEKG